MYHGNPNPEAEASIDSKWAMHLVMHWPDGEPMPIEQQVQLDNYFGGSEEGDLVADDFEVAPDIPYAYMSVAVALTKHEVALALDEADEDLSDIDEEDLLRLKKRAALAKGFDICLGGFEVIKQPLEELELDDCFIAQMVDDPDEDIRLVNQAAFREIELGYEVFSNSVDSHTELAKLLSR